jgi:hypothetical protein
MQTMIRLRIPETPDQFGNWLDAWDEMVSGRGWGRVTRMPSSDGWQFTIEIPGEEIRLSYEMEAPDILWVTGTVEKDADATEEQWAKANQALNALYETASAKWHQPRMTYSEAFRQIQAGGDKRAIKKEYMKWHPEKSDDAFYSAMNWRRRKLGTVI